LIQILQFSTSVFKTLITSLHIGPKLYFTLSSSSCKRNFSYLIYIYLLPRKHNVYFMLYVRTRDIDCLWIHILYNYRILLIYTIRINNRPKIPVWLYIKIIQFNYLLFMFQVNSYKANYRRSTV
jgi:hypothetical protein